jgi:DNA repair protein RadA/Sms
VTTFITCQGINEVEVSLFLGEVGLTGEVRSVPMMEMRLKEIAQMNYKRVITSTRAAEDLKGKFKIELIGITKARI